MEVMCCDEYKVFLDTYKDITVGYRIDKGKGVRIMLLDTVKFNRCPYCGDRIKEEK